MFKVAFFFIINQSSCNTLDLRVEQPIRFWPSVVYVSLGLSNTIEDNSNVSMHYYYNCS